MPNLIAYPDPELMALDLANRLADDLKEALHHEERVLFAVPGGTTPAPVFEALSVVHLDWDRVDVVLTDERWVPEDHPRSNTALVRRCLLQNEARTARLIPIYLAGHAPEDGLAECESLIAPDLPIHVALMGMGADMHTASLFPNAPNIAAALAPDAPILMVVRGEGLPETRVSLSARVLDAALRKHIVITGNEKKQALETAQSLPFEDAPVRAVLSGAEVHWAK